MPMAKSIASIRALPDEILIREHDEAAATTIVGTGFYLDELARREASRNADAVLRATVTVARLTWVITGLTVVNVVLVAVSILRG